MTDNFLSEIDREAIPPKVATDPPGFDRGRWGIFPDFPLDQYFAGMIPEITLSQSDMGLLLNETPLDYAYDNIQINPDQEKLESTVAQRRGDVVHQLALGKGKGFAVLDCKEFRSNEDKAKRDRAIADGLTPIKRADFEEAEAMAEDIKELIKVALDGADYQTEVAFLYQEMTSAGPIWVRGLMDVWCPERRMILDPKSTAMMYDSNVGRHMYNMGWDRQAALYPHAVGTILGAPDEGHVKFRDLMVKPKAPFTSRVVKLSKADEYQAIKECVAAMEIFGQCYHAGRWPGFEEEGTVDLPVWVRKAREARETGEVA